MGKAMAKSKGGSSKLMWLMVMLVFVSLAAASAAIYMVMSDDSPGQGQMQSQQIERQAPIFLKIDPFTVNLADDDFGSRLLYVGISLKIGNEETRDILKEHMPQVRSRLLMLFSGKEAQELVTPDGRRRLADDVMATLNEPMSQQQPSLDIQDVLFTEFIVQ